MQTLFQTKPRIERPGYRLRQCGGTLLELVVALAVISVLLYFLLDRMRYSEEMAEKSLMESTAAAMQSALRIETVSRMTRGEAGTIEEMARINPVKWLERPPENYLGEFIGSPPGESRRGAWHFDSRKRELVYRINLAEHFQSGNPADPQVRYRVVVEPGSVVATLTLIEPYQWR